MTGLISTKLGRCSKCIRASVLGAVLGWIVVIAIHSAWRGTGLWYPLLLWPLSFTVLWALHVTVFAARGITAQQQERRASPDEHPLGPMSRREMLRVFLHNATFAVAASSAFVVQPWRLQAMCYDHGTACTCHGQGCCQSGDVCGGTFPNTTCDTWAKSC